MSLLRGKNLWSTIFYSKITLVVLFFLCLLLMTSVYERYTIERKMAERRNEVEEKLRILQDRKYGLEEKVQYLEAEEGIEAEIRKNFDVAREGEQVVIIVDNEQTSDITTTETDEIEEKEEKSFWRQFLIW
ncbi:MAG: septum formation initiator family protein [Candidatus Paceibacterota bacterium]